METSKLPKVRTIKGLRKYQLKDINLDETIAVNSIYYKIGPYSTGRNFYRYMDIDIAIKCLKDGTLHFVEPSKWDDNYESRFYTATYDNVLNGKNQKYTCPRFFATCLTNKSENEPSWVIYSHGKKNAKCVQFSIDRKELRRQIIDYLENHCADKFKVYEGVVSYLWHGFIDNLDKETVNGENNELYDLFFNDFSLEKYLNLMLLKRDAFEHEKETRIMIVPEKQDKDKYDKIDNVSADCYLDIRIDWGKVIKGVKYDSNCSKSNIKKLKAVVKTLSVSHGNPIKIEPYRIYGEPEHITIGLKEELLCRRNSVKIS